MAEHPRGAVLRRAIETCLSPDDDTTVKLGELFTDNATVWSPNVLAVGLGRPFRDPRLPRRFVLRRRHQF